MTDLVHSTHMGCTRLDGLGTRSETIEAWCAATGLEADTIEWHEAFAALGTRILAQLLPVPPPGDARRS